MPNFDPNRLTSGSQKLRNSGAHQAYVGNTQDNVLIQNQDEHLIYHSSQNLQTKDSKPEDGTFEFNMQEPQTIQKTVHHKKS